MTDTTAQTAATNAVALNTALDGLDLLDRHALVMYVLHYCLDEIPSESLLLALRDCPVRS
jgi:hypothetical protein